MRTDGLPCAYVGSCFEPKLHRVLFHGQVPSRFVAESLGTIVPISASSTRLGPFALRTVQCAHKSLPHKTRPSPRNYNVVPLATTLIDERHHRSTATTNRGLPLCAVWPSFWVRAVARAFSFLRASCVCTSAPASFARPLGLCAAFLRSLCPGPVRGPPGRPFRCACYSVEVVPHPGNAASSQPPCYPSPRSAPCHCRCWRCPGDLGNHRELLKSSRRSPRAVSLSAAPHALPALLSLRPHTLCPRSVCTFRGGRALRSRSLSPPFLTVFAPALPLPRFSSPVVFLPWRRFCCASSSAVVCGESDPDPNPRPSHDPRLEV